METHTEQALFCKELHDEAKFETKRIKQQELQSKICILIRKRIKCHIELANLIFESNNGKLSKSNSLLEAIPWT